MPLIYLFCVYVRSQTHKLLLIKINSKSEHNLQMGAFTIRAQHKRSKLNDRAHVPLCIYKLLANCYLFILIHLKCTYIHIYTPHDAVIYTYIPTRI